MSKMDQDRFKKKNKICGSIFKLYWTNKEGENINFLISVPKKNIKKAVDRNTVKRRVKEFFNLNKSNIFSKLLRPINIIIIYNKYNLMEFRVIQQELLTLFESLILKVNENH